jgi:uncharacterized protein
MTDQSLKHFAIMAWDVPDSAPLRLAARDAHFARVEAIMNQVSIAGPLKDTDGAIIGSLIVVTAKDEAEAHALFEGDPYFAAGVWARHEIHAFLPAAGAWIGGKIW